MATTWKPIVAGILNMVVGVVTLFGTFITAIILVGVGGSVLSVSRIAAMMPVWLAGMAEGFMVILAVMLVVCSALPLIGGVYAVQRKNWGWALAGSIIAIFSSTIPGIASTVLVALSKDEFEKSNIFL